MKTTLRNTFALLFLSIAIAAHAQGTLRGVVTDSLDNSPLVGANVYLMGTALGSATNLEGVYRIERIPAGKYTLRISYIGYVTRDVAVEVEDDRSLALNVSLKADVLQGEEVIVTGQAFGQAAAINQQRTANTIINVVSEEKIQELPDANAAEAIGRLPGVSLRRSGGEANKIVLRGLSDRFTSITVDGVRIAATDSNARGVDLSTISQGSLAGIELYKALTPDKDADAIAGSVNLVTKKAPSERLLRADARGSYNDLGNTYDQYDFALRYGERFFNDIFGVQVSGNLEKRNRSKEDLNLDYDLRGIRSGTTYGITDFTLNYTDELRDRGGLSLLFDLDTPEGGSIRFNGIYNRTKRDFIEYERNYPLDPDNQLLYSARDREQEISTFTGAVSGDNRAFGLSARWGLSYANSESQYPFDYEIQFTEPSTLDPQGNPLSGMRDLPPEDFKGPVELIDDLAVNNFARSYLYGAYFRGQDNTDNEKTAYLNLGREYTLGNRFSGEFKIGGKYRDKSRDRSLTEQFSPYYIEAFAQYTRTSGGIVRKDFTGSRFASLATIGNSILLTNFLEATPVNRDLYGKYRLYPLINREAIRQWWDLNKNGYSDAAGRNPEYENNLEPTVRNYDIAERVSAGFVMNTFNYGQVATFIAGVRMENENNDYASKYSPIALSGFPVPKGTIRDTTAAHDETVWLPNFHLTLRPREFMNIRLAAYKALARPDFNHRLATVDLKFASTFFPGNTMIIGNTGLQAAKAWNYELSTSLFSNTIGLFTVSAFYKDVKDMFHVINGLPFSGQQHLDSLGISIRNPFATAQYVLTYPYNSTKPTRVWGFELEHQANLRFLPGLFRNFVLSYNFSVIRSETYVPRVRVESRRVPPLPIAITTYVGEENKQKLEGQPEFYGNFALGYDIGGLSARLSVFHQGKYNQSFSIDGRSDNLVDAFTRWDLAVKQQLTRNISVLMNVNNFTDLKEGTSNLNRVHNWQLLNTSEIYGLTADLGVRITL
ncbi:TonB-dependent receptor [candidate division KSB1 bacterium]|nr:TonB-dependent receptor [candidate division KSB1 bacterium]